MRVCVIGLGYVGLPTALKLAECGHNVIGVDINANLIEQLKSGAFTSRESGITSLYQGVWQQGKIQFQNIPDFADAFIISVPTPINKDFEVDVEAIISAATAIRAYVEAGTLVVLESTVPPGTTERLSEWIGEPFALYAHVPERVLPGRLLYELVHNARTIGGVSRKAAEEVAKLYRSFILGEIQLTTASVAEMAKLAENTYRDVNIAFANELTKVCHHLGISAQQVISLANRHPRVQILQPGPGVGGHCIAVDPWFIVSQAPDLVNLIRVARQTNDEQPNYIVGLLQQLTRSALRGKKVAVLGLSYKGNVDDDRESPSISIIDRLIAKGAHVVVHDPFVRDSRGWSIDSLHGACKGADAVVVACDHTLYAEIQPDQLEIKEGAVILDTRGILQRDIWEHAGHTVYVIGDGTPYKHEFSVPVTSFGIEHSR